MEGYPRQLIYIPEAVDLAAAEVFVFFHRGERS
jgi:hypothetical protein